MLPTYLPTGIDIEAIHIHNLHIIGFLKPEMLLLVLIYFLNYLLQNSLLYRFKVFYMVYRYGWVINEGN